MFKIVQNHKVYKIMVFELLKKWKLVKKNCILLKHIKELEF